jgi:nicotinate phosphoribosyltransferase
MAGDIITLEDDSQQGTPLLQLVMRAGQRLHAAPPLAAIREYAAAGLVLLPDHLRQLETDPLYAVSIAPALRALADAVDRRMSGSPSL